MLPLIERQLRALDEPLRPVARRAVDVTNAAWVATLKESSPLDEAGVRPQAEDLLKRITTTYADGDDATRASIRSLFQRFTGFAWAATLPLPTTTADGFRAHLLHFSILDQGTDPRDATLALDHLVTTARAAAVDVNSILTEIAALSSREDRYARGSTADWLLRCVQRPDFSGDWTLNVGASTLSPVVAPVVESGFVRIEHREPVVKVHLCITMDRKPFDVRFERPSNWEGDALFFVDNVETPGGELTIAFRYQLEDSGRRLRATERLRGAGREQDNVWVFDLKS